ncbi:hypothetical protein CDD81_1786 [Ophiocordyceps australis]|uniref:Secreted protein n=1 Tax=Ophiocordyceps australis TaxID=1399860 RepID=A0A2C5YDZ5_9HYPO|nr:hypothetical protein CDD81_1786 [Ophiocordyceps australis]
MLYGHWTFAVLSFVVCLLPWPQPVGATPQPPPGAKFTHAMEKPEFVYIIRTERADTPARHRTEGGITEWDDHNPEPDEA